MRSTCPVNLMHPDFTALIRVISGGQFRLRRPRHAPPFVGAGLRLVAFIVLTLGSWLLVPRGAFSVLMLCVGRDVMA